MWGVCEDGQSQGETYMEGRKMGPRIHEDTVGEGAAVEINCG